MTRSGWLAVTVSLWVHGALVGWLVFGGWKHSGAPAGNAQVLEVRVVTEEAVEGIMQRKRSKVKTKRPGAGTIPASLHTGSRMTLKRWQMHGAASSRKIPDEATPVGGPRLSQAPDILPWDPLDSTMRSSPSNGSNELLPAHPPEDILQEIRARIERVKAYPLWARRRGIQGVTLLAFRIRQGGSVDNLRVVRSSGSSLLDQASLEAVRQAVPFPKVDGEIQVSLVFRLQPLQAEAEVHEAKEP